MDDTLTSLFNNAQSEIDRVYEPALSDLRFIIERFTMERYGKEEESDYVGLFYRKDLINYRLEPGKIDFIKHFLFYLLLNFPDRAISTAKCIRVLFDKSIYEALCTAIEVYMEKNDFATCELIYAITNSSGNLEYFQSKRVSGLFERILEFGGEYSRAIIKDCFEFRRKYEDT